MLSEKSPPRPHMQGIIAPELVDRIKLSMTRRNWRYGDLAKAAGVGDSSVHRLLRGERIRPSTVEKICQALIDNPPDTAISKFLDSEEAI